MEETMKITAISVLVVLMLAGMAFAGDEGNGCKLEGTWIVGGPNDWWLTTETFQGKGDNISTFLYESATDLGGWFALPPGVGNPVGVQIPNARVTLRNGIWAKTGPNTYKTRSQGYVVQKIDFYGITVEIPALVFLDTQTITLKDCNTAELAVETPYFFPGEEEPFFTWATLPGEPGIMKRLLMSQEYPFQPSE